jgi:hypothetical protein
LRQGAARHACRRPPAPSAGEAHAVAPISDALAGSRAPPSGAPSPPVAAASVRRRFTRVPGARAVRAVFSDVAAKRPRASRPLVRCDGYPTPHRNRVESMLGSGAAHRVPRLSPHGPCEPEQPETGGAPERALLPEAVGTRCVERGRANPACQRAPEISFDLRVAERPAAREQLASRLAARFSHLDGSPDGRLLPVSCPWGRPLALRERRQEHALQRIAHCRAPTPVLTEARVNGPALHGFGAPFVRTSVRFRAPPADYLPIEMKPEHARE